MSRQHTDAGTQMTMRGILDHTSLRTVKGGEQLRPGVEVTYRGHVRGGPRFGATGVVREMRGRRVVVDLQGYGIWHIPFYFLSTSLKAA